MSSVGSSDSSNRADSEVARRNREEAKAHEAEVAKRNADKLRGLSDQHYAELEKLKGQHNKQMDDLRKESRQDISERDHHYNQEMEELRGLYKKQLQEQADEANHRDAATRASLGGELSTTKAASESKVGNLQDQSYRTARETEKKIADITNDLTEKEGEAIDGNKDRLTKHFTTREQQMRDERDKTVSGLQRDYTEYRAETSATLRDKELRHHNEQQRSSDNMLRAVRNERMHAQDTQESMKDGFMDAMDKTKERFENANRKQREANSISRDQTKSTVMDRIENQVERLEHDKEDLKDASVNDSIKLKEKQRREIANVADSYQKNMDNYREQRDEAVRSSNDRNHKDIGKVRKELENQAVETNRFYRQQGDERNMIHRTAVDNLKGGFDARAEQIKNTADNRVKNLFEKTNEEKTRMSEFIAENHVASQHSHQDDMRTLRAALEADKQIAVSTLTEHIQKQEIGHAERMSQVVAKYEKQITGLQDQVLKEKKQNEENLKRSTQDMQVAHKTAMDQLEAKNRERLRELNSAHSEEVRIVNKRHEEKLDQVLGEVKRS